MNNTFFSIVLLLVTAGPYNHLCAQDISFERLSELTIYGDVKGQIYQNIGQLTNNSSDSIDVTYTRTTKEISHKGVVNGLCTEILCCEVFLDTITERIAPKTIHKVESRWSAFAQDLEDERGYSVWTISNTLTGEIIANYENEFIYKELLNHQEDLYEYIEVYPNPAFHELTLPSSEFDALSIFNLQGQKLIEQNIKNLNHINISTLQPGVYLGLATKESQYYRFKFIKN